MKLAASGTQGEEGGRRHTRLTSYALVRRRTPLTVDVSTPRHGTQSHSRTVILTASFRRNVRITRSARARARLHTPSQFNDPHVRK